MQLRTPKLQRLPIPVHADVFKEYGYKAVCSNHVLHLKIGKPNQPNLLVDSEQDLTSDLKPPFNPLYTHQVSQPISNFRSTILMKHCVGILTQ